MSLGTSLGPLPGLRLAAAQRLTGAIAGRVVDQDSHSPVAHARVLLLGTPRDSASDSSGRFEHAGLPPGTYFLQVQAVGYSATTWLVRLAEGQVVEQDFEVAPLSYELSSVTARANPGVMVRRLQEFERRRATGRGVFVTEEQIRRINAGTLSDVLRMAAGVQTQCNSVGCSVRMTRAARAVCRPEFVVDGFPATMSTNANLPANGIVAVEIYRSDNEIPSEFLKADGSCGAIVIWTRSAPDR